MYISEREAEELIFGLDSMYEHCRLVMEDMTYGDKPFDEKTYDYCEALADECEALRWKGRYTKAEISRIREIAVEREIMRDMKGGLL